MLIEPKQIEMPFFKRVLKTSLKLYKKNITAFLLFSCVVYGAAFLSTLITSLYPKMMFNFVIGLIVFAVGIEISANVDFGSFNVSHLLKYFKRAFVFTKETLKNHFMYFVSMLSIIFIMYFVVKEEEAVIKDLITDSYFNMSKIIFWGVVFFSQSFLAFTFSALRYFEIDIKAAEHLSENGLEKNKSLKFNMVMIFPLVAILSPMFSFGIFLFFVIPIFPIFFYILFKEIFLGTKELEKQESKQNSYNLATELN